MQVLVYKRTHEGDPDSKGCFGIFDCMGSVRGRSYDAVIGVGGLGPKAQAHEIAGKITWIGIGPHVRKAGKRGPEVLFDHFLYLGKEGPDFRERAPALSHRIYSRNIRSIIAGMTPSELDEVIEIVKMAKRSPPSLGLSRRKTDRVRSWRGKCGVRSNRTC